MRKIEKYHLLLFQNRVESCDKSVRDYGTTRKCLFQRKKLNDSKWHGLFSGGMKA